MVAQRRRPIIIATAAKLAAAAPSRASPRPAPSSSKRIEAMPASSNVSGSAL